jgi:hypothetical protein
MKNNTLRYVAGVLLISSMITHVAQVFFVGTASHSLVAAGYGVLYGIVGAALLLSDQNRYVFLLGALLPAIGGVLGSIRFVGMITVENTVNYFIIYHLFVDIIVVPSCLVLYQRLHGGLPARLGAVAERVGR